MSGILSTHRQNKQLLMLTREMLSVWHLKYFLLTSFIPLFSLNVLGKSVLIVMATISTALDWRLCRLTKSSLHTIAAALPSEVGLRERGRRRSKSQSKIMEFIGTRQRSDTMTELNCIQS